MMIFKRNLQGQHWLHYDNCRSIGPKTMGTGIISIGLTRFNILKYLLMHKYNKLQSILKLY